MDKKPKVLIITPCGLPVPAVKGGAVATLVESLIIQNDIHKKANFTIVSSYTSEAENKSKKYVNSKFIFLKTPKICSIIDNFYDSSLSKAENPHRYTWKYYIINRLKKFLLDEDFDAVVFENSGYLLNVLKNKKILSKYKGKLYYHLHNDIPSNIYINGVKECTLLMISNYLRKKVISLCGQEIDRNVRILHNGFNYKMFAQGLSLEEKRSLKQELDIPEEKKIVVFAGRINRDKGIEELTTAFNMLNRDDVVLLVIGSYFFADKRISEFERKMKQTFENMKDRVRFTGFVPYENMWKYYSIADLAVLPSMWEEPAGLTIVESMSAGLPVITTNSGGIPEFIDDRFGIILERDDKLIENIKLSINNILDNLSEWKLRGEKSSKYIAQIVDEEKYYNTFCEYIS